MNFLALTEKQPSLVLFLCWNQMFCSCVQRGSVVSDYVGSDSSGQGTEMRLGPPSSPSKACFQAHICHCPTRAWKERCGAKRDKKKKSFKARVDKKIQAAVTKALKEKANDATPADQGQAGASSPVTAKPPPAASQVTAAAAGATAGNQPPLPTVSFVTGPPAQVPPPPPPGSCALFPDT